MNDNERIALLMALSNEVGITSASVLVQRLVDIRTLAEVGEMIGESPARVRQIEATAIRTMSPDMFEWFTAAVRQGRPAFQWGASVARQRASA